MKSDAFIINLREEGGIIPLSVCVTKNDVLMYRDNGKDALMAIPREAFDDLIDWYVGQVSDEL